MTIGYGELKKGMSIEMDGEPYSVVEYERSKMQQRAPVMRIRFRNLKTGRVVDKTFSGYDVSLPRQMWTDVNHNIFIKMKIFIILWIANLLISFPWTMTRYLKR